MMMRVIDLEAGYGVKQVLYGISLAIKEGEIVGMIGHNGAGKSTTLRSIFGTILPRGGRVIYRGEDLTTVGPSGKLKRGIYHLPQDNFVFNDLTVKENLEISFFTRGKAADLQTRLEQVESVFPILRAREKQLARTLSGGERRMLGIAMGLLHHPSLMLLDEPSSGLSPLAFQNVVRVVRDMNKEFQTAVLLVEQNVRAVAKLSSRVYVMKAGRIILEENGEELLKRSQWWDLF